MNYETHGRKEGLAHFGEDSVNVEDGFTLIEILAVIMILAVAVSFVYPEFSSLSNRLTEDAEVSKLEAVIAAAREYSITRRSDCTVDVEAGFVRAVAGGELVLQHGMTNGLIVRGDEPLIFHPDGTASGGVLYLEMPNGASVRFEVSRLTGGLTTERTKVDSTDRRR